MVNVKNEGCEFYKLVITFKDAGEDRIAYVDSDHDHREMFSRSALFTNIQIKPVKPTQEQIDRLAEVNALDLTNAEIWADSINKYIQHGYIKSAETPIVGKFFIEAEQTTKQHLIDVISSKLAEHRYNKEVSGSKYETYEVLTDRESQATITSTIVALQAGLLTSVNFKFKNGWKELDAVEFVKVATSISNHVNDCFKAEELTIRTLEALTIEELNEIVYPTPTMYGLEEDVVETLNPIDMFESNYLSLQK